MPQPRFIPNPDTPYRRACCALVEKATPIDWATKPLRTTNNLILRDTDGGLQLAFLKPGPIKQCSFVAALLERGPIMLLIDSDDDGQIDSCLPCAGDEFCIPSARLVCPLIDNTSHMRVMYWIGDKPLCSYAVVTFVCPSDVPNGAFISTPTPNSVNDFFMRRVPRKAHKVRAAVENKYRMCAHEDYDRLEREARCSERIQADALQKKAAEEERHAKINASRAARAAVPPKPFTPKGQKHKTRRSKSTPSELDLSKRLVEKETSLAKLASQKGKRAEFDKKQETEERMRRMAIAIGYAINDEDT